MNKRAAELMNKVSNLVSESGHTLRLSTTEEPAAQHCHSLAGEVASNNLYGGGQLSAEKKMALQEILNRTTSSPIDCITEISRRAQLARDKDDFATAEAEQEEAVCLAKEAGANIAILINELTGLGIIYEEYYKFGNGRTVAKALKTYKHALQLAIKHYGPDDMHLVTILDGLACVYSYRGNDKRAVAFYEQALSILRRSGAENTMHVAALETDAALIHFFRKKYRIAEALLRHAAAVVETAPEPENRQLSRVLNNMALVVTGAGRETEGIEIMKQAIQLDAAFHGTSILELISFLQNMGGLHALAGQWDDAEQSHHRAIAISSRRVNPYPEELKELTQEMKAIKARRWTKPVAFFLLAELDRGYMTTHPGWH